MTNGPEFTRDSNGEPSLPPAEKLKRVLDAVRSCVMPSLGEPPLRQFGTRPSELVSQYLVDHVVAQPGELKFKIPPKPIDPITDEQLRMFDRGESGQLEFINKKHPFYYYQA